MMPITIHWNQPQELNAIFERDTTPRVDLRFFESVDQAGNGVGPIDVTAFAFEVYFKAGFSTDNEDATLTFLDADLEKNPEAGQTNVLRIPITRANTNNDAELPDSGVWIAYRTDVDANRVRIFRGTVTMRP
jgi:hypothetical protein